MSASGKKFSDTLRLGVVCLCSPCARNNKNVAAIKYCVDCDEDLCSICLKHHNKFTVMRAHQITDNLSSQTGDRYDLPTERCDRHGRGLIVEYCTTHDVVGCSDCFSIEHGSCKGILYIPDMTVAVPDSKISDLETKMTQLSAQLDRLKQQKQDNLKLLQQEEDKLLKEIKDLRQKLKDKHDKMEQTLLIAVESKLGTKAREVSKDLNVINNEWTSLEKRHKSLQSAKRGNNTQQFVELKMGQSLVQETERIIRSISTGSNTVIMQVLPCSSITTLLQTDKTALGNISEMLITKSATHVRDVNVRLLSDKETCYVTDICLTLNGDVYIADCNNCLIKKLNDSYAVTEHIHLPGYPRGLCEVDSKRLAVTLCDKMKVQFLSQNQMSLGESFYVRDHCRGIDCHNGQLYVCCGGQRDFDKCRGCIKVYNMGGELLRVYYQGANCPLYVHVSVKGDLLISNDDRESLVTLRMHDSGVSNLQIKALRHPREMFRLSDNLLGVAGYVSNNIVLILEDGEHQQELFTEKDESNNIVLISEDGEHQQELLTEKDGISLPLAACFDRQHSHLIVSCDKSDNIKIFKVST